MNYRRWFRLRPQNERDVAREIDEELQAHVQLRSDDLERAGTPAERAHREALNKFGDYGEARRVLIEGARHRRAHRRRTEWLDELRQDFVYAIRRARQAPAHSLFTIAVLAGGIGLTTGTFTVVNDVLIRSLPFAQPDRIYSLSTLDSAGGPVPTVSITDWMDWRQQSKSLESSALYRTFRTPVITGSEALRSTVTQTVGDFFSVLATPMLIGRAYTDAEAQAGDGGVVVSDAFWRSVLGARSLPITITVGNRARDVIGVVRAGHEFPRGTDVWVGEVYRSLPGMYRNFINYEAIARRKSDITLSQTDQELDAIALRIRQQDPAALYSYGVVPDPLKNKIVGDAAVYLPIVMAAVLCVLLMGCANLAGLNLARGRARTREVAVRAALGAGRGRLLRQLLVEHIVIAIIAGALGLLLASAFVRAAIAYAGSVLPRADEIAIDPAMALLALAISIVCGVLTGILPAFQLTKSALRDRLAGARGTVAGGKQLPGAMLVAVEIAAAVLLLTGGTLLLRSYRALIDRDIGFDTNVIAADVVLSNARYPEAAQKIGYWDRLIDELRNVPGIEAVGAANWVPLGSGAMTFIEVEGNSAPNQGSGYRAVGDDYFRALGVPILAGRAIERRDDAGTQRVAVINRAMSEQFWPGQNPIGRRVRTPVMETGPNRTAPPWLTVVGVVGDLRHWGIETDPNPELYVAYRQVPIHTGSMTAIVRTRVNIDQTIAALRQRIRQVDPQTPADLGTLQQRLDASLRVRQLITSILSLFGILALSLAAMGLYSLLAFAVAQRSREIAVRLALGARQNTLIRLVFGNAMTIAVAGVVVGLAVAIALMRFLSTLLVDVRPLDPLTLVTVPLFLLAVAGLAAWIPARRASRVSPLVVLNRE